MRYTILFPVNELRIGGAEQQLLELVRGLDKARFHPIVAPLYPGGALDAEFRVVPGATVVDLDRRGKFDPSPLWRIAALIRRYRVDVVQPFLSPATFFGLAPALILRVPVTIVTERCGARRVRGLGYKAYRTLEDLLSRRVDAIVPNSAAGQELLLARGLPAAKIRVIYNGINPDRLRVDRERVDAIRAELRAPATGFVVGILASLTVPKGHDTLLRAVASLAPRYPGLRLAIVGDGPRRADLEAQATALGLGGRAVFFGYRRDVADFLAAFDLLVSASRDNEGCSNSILEAMLLGVPVVATDVGGNRELVHHGETGFLVPVGDPESLALAIEETLANPDRARTVAARAREMAARRFGLARMVRAYEDLYLELLGERSRMGALQVEPVGRRLPGRRS